MKKIFISIIFIIALLTMSSSCTRNFNSAQNNISEHTDKSIEEKIKSGDDSIVIDYETLDECKKSYQNDLAKMNSYLDTLDKVVVLSNIRDFRDVSATDKRVFARYTVVDKNECVIKLYNSLEESHSSMPDELNKINQAAQSQGIQYRFYREEAVPFEEKVRVYFKVAD
ncbi:hypothetical protein [Eubacterium maltosivorans]|uniref:hypothetical protein n=1 Tax=Eubacterium maltosivorans TaxID=2041044 RepID=UPI00189DA933|nr:hypothetical protein [Eubacterium maltosivorans]